MVYIIREYDDNCESYTIIGVIETDLKINKLYSDFVQEKAKEMDIVINPDWLNIANHQDHNTHLTKSQYNKKDKDWTKFLKQNTLLMFVKSELGLSTKVFDTLSNDRS
jgi:hypothetical protein